MIHHIAIATPNLKTMSAFYKTLPGLKWKEDKFTADKNIRATWFEINGDNSLLMLEDFPYAKAPEALIFQLDASVHLDNFNFPIVKRTNFTIYFLDPDNNQLGYSSYPIELREAR